MSNLNTLNASNHFEVRKKNNVTLHIYFTMADVVYFEWSSMSTTYKKTKGIILEIYYSTC
jgi:hypothetical protein